jgi:RNA polymerase sigma-70 factor (ECF subfamily)
VRTLETVEHAVESVARESYGRLVAYLSARTRDPAGAEDALGDALLAALTTWPRDGIPASPEGWLLTAARNRLTDHARHRLVRAQSEPTLQIIMQSRDWEDRDLLPDQRLNLMLVCAHPAIDSDMHTPLMLQMVLGLDAAAIGRAFLVAPQAMGQRLVRAKTKIRQTRIAFEIPGADSLPARLTAVLNAIYAAFGDSWEDADGADAHRAELVDEAIWLARLLSNLLAEEPEVRGLLALMLHCEARRPARRSSDGRYVPLADQNCALWREPLIEEAERQLALASHASRVGRYQLEAAIQSVHAERRRSGKTQWCAIAAFYDRLATLTGAVGVEVGRAAAHAEIEGPAAALTLLDRIDRTLSSGYQPYWAVRGHLLDQMGRGASAVAAYTCAIDLTADEAVRGFLLQRRAAAANSQAIVESTGVRSS